MATLWGVILRSCSRQHASNRGIFSFDLKTFFGIEQPIARESLVAARRQGGGWRDGNRLSESRTSSRVPVAEHVDLMVSALACQRLAPANAPCEEGWPTDRFRFNISPLPSPRNLFHCRVRKECSSSFPLSQTLLKRSTGNERGPLPVEEAHPES